MLGVRRREIPNEPPGRSTNSTTLQPLSYFGSGIRTRMAGDVLDLNLLQPGVVPEPYAPGADLRNELRAGIRDLDL